MHQVVAELCSKSLVVARSSGLSGLGRSLLLVLFLCVAWMQSPSAWSQTDPWNTCIENGGNAKCTDRQLGAPTYSVDQWVGGYYPSEQALYAAILNWGSAYCSFTAQAPAYPWAVSSIGSTVVIWNATISYSGTKSPASR